MAFIAIPMTAPLAAFMFPVTSEITFIAKPMADNMIATDHAQLFALNRPFATISVAIPTGINTAPITVSMGPLVEGESVNTTTATTEVSNDPLGRLFMVVEFGETNVNPINATYIQTSTVNNVTLILPDNATVTAAEIANVTVNILPNGLAIDKGQSHIIIEGDDGSEQEIATTTFVDLARLNPDGSGSGTGIVFFSTNSTGQLAFLDGMVGINDSEFSPGTGTVRVWEWKGDTIPFENSNALQ